MRRFALALVFVAIGCRPVVHVHVYDDDGEDDGTASGFTGSSAAAGDSSGDSSNPSSDSSNPSSDSNDDSNGDSSSPATTGTGSSGGGSSGGSSDPYPPPVDGACPGELGYNADGNFEFCGAPCGDGDSCPPTETGNVLTMCVFNPDSSMDACQSAMCADPEESCFAGTCMLPPTHCAPLCSTMDAVCPDGMECTTNEVCRFPMP